MATPVRDLAPLATSGIAPSPLHGTTPENSYLHLQLHAGQAPDGNPYAYLTKYDPLKYSNENKEPYPAPSPIESGTEKMGRHFEDRMMAVPKTQKMKARADIKKTEKEEELINYILNDLEPGGAYVIIVNPNGENIIIKMPIAYCDHQYDCGRVEVYRMDGTLLERTGCCHVNCPCIARDVCLIVGDFLLALLEACLDSRTNRRALATGPPHNITPHNMKEVVGQWLAIRGKPSRISQKENAELYKQYVNEMAPNLQADVKSRASASAPAPSPQSWSSY
ncbi:hypothetical protein PTTG_26834 [Puccinia triticina 1-1 BBBD Race 1]|uniref:Uncharacterized protein n=2 Tax=Puccinia triticina TaxID=208348 RepID=A0A180GSP1_PUCT1|nr:hypothetical protein PTTG_26834 [Puccinia triticina 1-1 BBBD Race 1]